VLDPEFTPVLNRLGLRVCSDGHMDARSADATVHCGDAGGSNPEDSYGDILFKAGRYSEARAHFESALKKILRSVLHSMIGRRVRVAGNQGAARELRKIGARGGESTTRPRIPLFDCIELTVRENLYGFADREYATLEQKKIEKVHGPGSRASRSDGLYQRMILRP